MKRLPYGLSDFKEVIENFYYIDKTKYIPLLENTGNFLYLIRPRRFGKSLFLNMLDFYYNKRWSSYWDDFKGTYIYDNPTTERHSYLVLKFDFSAVFTVGDIEYNFNEYCNRTLNHFLRMNKLNISIDEQKAIHLNLYKVFKDLEEFYPNEKVYILIDEYDNFINNLLMNNKPLYEKFVSSEEAIYKEFFKLLKALTNENSSPLKRMFFTGVSPLALFDVTSGSNIGINITNNPLFNNIIGIDKQELNTMLEYYNLTNSPYFENYEFIDSWYNHYKFSERVDYTIYNTDMILYYTMNVIQLNQLPNELVDINVRTDYTKLKYLVHTNNKLNGNFDVLKTLFTENYILVDKIKDSFSAFEITKQENFISLLYYLGLITIEKKEFGDIKLKIPNNTIQTIMAEFIKVMLEETNTLEVDLREFHQKVKELAFFNKLDVFYYIAEKLKENTSIRDLVHKESDIKMFYMTYFSLNRLYAPISELELNQGYADIFLIKAPNIEEDIPNILIEFKFLKQNEKLTDDIIQKAKEQIAKYSKTTKFRVDKAIIVVFRGFEIEHLEEIVVSSK